MADLISRQQLIGELEARKAAMGDPVLRVLVDRVIEVVKRQEGAKDINVPSNWIPVTERWPEDLPENKGKKVIPCLVAYRPNETRKLTTQFRQRAFSEHLGWYWKKLGACSITHWMPLPEPPKEG